MKLSKDIIDVLSRNGLVSQAVRLPHDTPLPWYMRVFSGLCGWIVSWLLVGFLGLNMIFVVESTAAMIVLGLVLIAAAFGLLKQKNSDFVEQGGLGVSFAGQIFITAALLSNGAPDDALTWFVLTLMHCALAAMMPNTLHRLLSAYFATIALALLVEEIGVASLLSPLLTLCVSLLWLNEFNLTRRISVIQGIGYGLTVGLIQFKTSVLFTSFGTWGSIAIPTINPWIDGGLNAVILLFVINQMIKKQLLRLGNKDRVNATALLTLVLIASVFANGIVCGVIILL